MLNNITFKHRLIGAIFLVSLAVILIPAFLDTPSVDTLAGKESLPEAPLVDGQGMTKIEYSFTELMTDLPEEPVAAITTVENEPVPVTPDAPVEETNVLASQETVIPSLDQAAVISEETAAVLEQPIAVSEEAAVPTLNETVVAKTEQLIIDNTWAVQLGAFSKADNAQDLLKRLQEKGYVAYTELMPDTQLTRVLVGAEADRSEAAALLSELDNALHLKGIVVKINSGSAN